MQCSCKSWCAVCGHIEQADIAAAVPSRLQVESTSVAVHYIAHRQQEKQWEEEQEGQQPCRQRHVSG